MTSRDKVKCLRSELLGLVSRGNMSGEARVAALRELAIVSRRIAVGFLFSPFDRPGVGWGLMLGFSLVTRPLFSTYLEERE